jgi:hypothetical protein
LAPAVSKLVIVKSNIFEFEAICKKALIHDAGVQMGLFDGKTRGRKSRDTVPLNKLKYDGGP